MIKSKSNSHIIRPGLKFDGKNPIPFEKIPGLLEAGWTKEMERYLSVNVSSVEPKKSRLYEFMKSILSELQSHAAAWPFMEPVNPAEVTDYYSVIKEPMGKN